MHRLILGFLSLALLLTFPLHAQPDPTSERGFAADKAFQIGDLDHVNLFNGNLAVTLPVGPTYPAGGGLEYGLTLTYNSNLWDFDHSCGDGDPGARCFTIATPAPGFTVGAGWNLSMGRLLRPGTEVNDTGRWSYVSPDGSSHAFYPTLHAEDPDENPPPSSDPDDLEVGYSRDGSYLRMLKVSLSERIVEMPDGTRRVFFDPGVPGPQANEWLLKRIEDRFGNEVSVSYLPNDDDWDEWHITDDHGRTQKVIFERTPDLEYHPKRVQSVELEGFAGTTSVYSFIYSEATLTRGCPHNHPDVTGSVTVPLLIQLQLPDGSSYAMQEYSNNPSGGCGASSGGLRKLRLPTRGVIEWTYQGYVYPFREQDFPIPPPPNPPPQRPKSVGVKERIEY